MMYWNGHMTTAGWIIAILWTVIILVLIAGAIAWLATTLTSHGPSTTGGAADEASAREILDRRLAKGELTVEQYKQLREVIDGGASRVSDEPPARAASASG